MVGPVYGHSIYIGRHAIACGYPLLGELARVCFGLDKPPADRSIEALFQDADEARNPEPMRHLAHALMKADYYLAARLIPALGAPSNPYSQFFERFGESHFLTFNYDSLVELFLLHQEQWYPHDGYGVPVATEVLPGHESLRDRSSSSFVLHLHGSLCLYNSTFTFERASGERVPWYTPREEPKFLFDPSSIGSLFSPFTSSPLVLGYDAPERRVIAPVPDKTASLKKEFITTVYQRSSEILASAPPLIALGYSFNPLDRSSFAPILGAAASVASRVVIVSPIAEEITTRLSSDYPGAHFEPIPHTLETWVSTGFPGVL